MHSPVEQFTIKALFNLELFGYDVSFTNSALFMMLSVILSVVYLTYAVRRREMIPGRVQASAEMLYEFISDMVKAMLVVKVVLSSHLCSHCSSSCCSAICLVLFRTHTHSRARLLSLSCSLHSSLLV